MKIEELFKAVNKATLQNEVMSATPKDFADRNRVYMHGSVVLGWLLQGLSVIAGAYLFFDFLKAFATNEYYTATIWVCGFALFFLLEGTTRFLLNSLGYHYLATYNIKNGIKTNGTILQTKAVFYICLRVIMLLVGTHGVATFFFNTSYLPKIKDVKTVVSPINNNLDKYNQSIKHDEVTIAKLQAERKNLTDNQNTNNYWAVYTQVENIDKQIQSVTANKQKTLELVSKMHERVSVLEDNTHKENKAEVVKTEKNSLFKSGIAGGVWFSLEIVLFWLLIYVWVYKVGVKRELLLREVLKTNEHNKPVESPQVKAKQEKTPIVYNTPKPEVETKDVDTAPKVFVKTETVTEIDGYNCTCLTCKTQVVKKRPAKFCGGDCKNKWYHSKLFTEEVKKARLAELGYDANAYPAIVPLKNA